VIPGGPDMDTVYRLTMKLFDIWAQQGNHSAVLPEADEKEYQAAFDRLAAQGFTGDQIDLECERRFRTERVNKALRSITR
jgi:hypothetical protein